MDRMSRRAFVGGGVAVAWVGVGLVGLEGAAVAVGRVLAAAPGLTRSRFAPLVGSRLELRDGARKASVRLIGIRDLPGTRPANVERQFSLLFESIGALDWPQQTYELRSPRLGRLSLFAVPMAGGSGGRGYVAVVNNPLEAGAV